MIAGLCNKSCFCPAAAYLQHLQTTTNKTICVSEPDNFSETQKFATTKLNRLTLSRTTLHTYRASFGVLAAA